MILTFIGVIELLLGLGLFLAGSLNSLFVFTIMATLFGGSAAVYLPALGGSSITPATFSLMFLIPRILAPGTSQFPTMIEAIKANRWLIVFVLYGVMAAYVMPRLFAGQIDVTPMRGRTRDRYGSTLDYIYATERLRPSPQNITTSVYMIGTLMLSIASCTLMRRDGSAWLLAKVGGILGIAHATIGLASVFLKNTPFDMVFELFRNGSYAQLDHAYKGFERMRGIWPEASGYGNFALIWFVFNFECWLRHVASRWTGAAAALLALALLLSTSSTAYLGLSAFALLVAIRAVVSPGLISGDRIIWLALLVLASIAGAILTLKFSPAFTNDFVDLVKHMTVDKPNSVSGRQRRFWAEQGLHAFVASYGLGIGPGAFRSSSLATAILGCTGAIGTIAFMVHMVRVTGPLRLSTYVRVATDDLNVGGAAAWALVVGFLTLSISWPSCDPGIEIALLGGAAIALRDKARPARNSSMLMAKGEDPNALWRPAFPPALNT